MGRARKGIVCLSLACASAGCLAQEVSGSDVPSATFDLGASDALALNDNVMLDKGDGAFSVPRDAPSRKGWPDDLVLAPIPGYNPEFGWTLAIAAAYFLDLDKENEDSRHSIVGVGGIYTENDSWGVAAAGKFYLAGDKLRLGVVGYDARVNYRFWGVGNDAGDRGLFLDLGQDYAGYYLSGVYEWTSNFYAGIGYFGGEVRTEVILDLDRFLKLPIFDFLPIDPDEVTLPDIPNPAFTIDFAYLDIPFKYDSRDDTQYPRRGWFIDARVSIASEALGSDFESETFKIAVNHYRSVRDHDVVATRFFYRTVGGDPPFFMLSSFGGSPDLRGYDVGRYRDKMLYAIQSEYRWQAFDRWIFTGFAGVGEVAPDLGSFLNNFLPAAGVGTRFVLSPKHDVHVSFDAAWGKDGGLFYFSIGEAF